MLWIVATITTTAGRGNDVFDALCAVAPEVREEAGCHAYHPCLDSERGLAEDYRPRPDTITVVEAWASHAALEAHLATQHMQRFHAEVDDWVTGRDIRLLSPAG